MLCMGGTCKCVLKRDSGVTDNFLLQHVVSNITKHFDNDVSLIFDTTLLYYIYADQDQQVPSIIKRRVCDAVRVERSNQNPVNRIHVVCTGHDGEVYILMKSIPKVPNLKIKIVEVFKIKLEEVLSMIDH